jgi:hypothetical protein
MPYFNLRELEFCWSLDVLASLDFDCCTYGDAIAQRQNAEVLSLEGRLASFQRCRWCSEDRGR